MLNGNARMLQQRIDSNTRIIDVGGRVEPPAVKSHNLDSGAFESELDTGASPPDPWTIRQSRLMKQRVNINVGGERHQVRSFLKDFVNQLNVTVNYAAQNIAPR